MSSSRVSESRELSRLWQAVIGHLQLGMNPAAFETWLEGSRALRRTGDTMIVEARSSFVADWLTENLSMMVEGAVAAASNERLRVEFIAPGQRPESPPQPQSSARDQPRETPGRLVGTLNRDFTFERYLPTMGNRLAIRMCTDLVDDPSTAVSPLSVYGVPGMGKTHLLHAVTSYAVSRGRSCACLTAEEFTNRYQRALRPETGETVQEFHQQIRTVDLLIIDDLQAIAGMSRTMDELVYTMDAVKHAAGSLCSPARRTRSA